MNVLIRVDCSKAIGMGHLIRCVALASCLKKHARVIFVIQDLIGNQAEYLKLNGFEVYPIYVSTMGDLYSWEDDARQTINIINQMGIQLNLAIVDHYKLDAKWEDCLYPHSEKLMVIDDLANRPHHCDFLLDQNYYYQNDRYRDLLPKKTVQLLGPDFALLRNEFLHNRLTDKKRNGIINKILIFFGGGDYAKETLRAINVCLKLINIDIDVVVGEASSHKEEIKQICDDHPNIHYFCQIENVADLMMNADLCIGAGGTSIWERCSLGLPSLVMAVAENQIEVARSASLLGVLEYLGEARMVDNKILSDKLEVYLRNPSLLHEMSAKARNLVDGMGCEKVTKRLLHDR